MIAFSADHTLHVKLVKLRISYRSFAATDAADTVATVTVAGSHGK